MILYSYVLVTAPQQLRLAGAFIKNFTRYHQERIIDIDLFQWFLYFLYIGITFTNDFQKIH